MLSIGKVICPINWPSLSSACGYWSLKLNLKHYFLFNFQKIKKTELLQNGCLTWKPGSFLPWWIQATGILWGLFKSFLCKFQVLQSTPNGALISCHPLYSTAITLTHSRLLIHMHIHLCVKIAPGDICTSQMGMTWCWIRFSLNWSPKRQPYPRVFCEVMFCIFLSLCVLFLPHSHWFPTILSVLWGRFTSASSCHMHILAPYISKLSDWGVAGTLRWEL